MRKALIAILALGLVRCGSDETSAAPDSGTEERDSGAETSALSCSDVSAPKTGHIVITRLVAVTGARTACGGEVASVTFDFYPSDGTAPLREQTELEYAGAPLTRRCAELVGMEVGGTYSNVTLQRSGDRCHFEHYTDSPTTYNECYYARCSSVDAGED